MQTNPAKSRIKKPQQNSKNTKFDRELATECERLIGNRVVSMQYPGGSGRDSVRLLLKHGAPVFVSKRSRKPKADIEKLVLKSVHAKGANVPKLIATNGQTLLIQEEIPGLRLSQALHKQPSDIIYQHLDNALESLSRIQKAGSESGLDQKLPVLGDNEEWLQQFLVRPQILGNFFNIPCPELNLKTLQQLLAIRQPRFVKWDSRPGNAIVNNDDQVFWIDWEHSGTRNRLDDMVWLLADEFIPHRPNVEKKLLERHIANYADDLSVDEARDYFFTLGSFHLVIRMGLIYKYKKDGNWWSYDKCLAGDKAGVTLKNMLRICKRGKRWAAQTSDTQPLSQWFSKIEAQLT